MSLEKLKIASRHILAPLGIIIIVACHFYDLVPYQERLRTLLFDFYQTTMPRERMSAPVVIVDIDEASLKDYGQWPWPRSLLAMLINRVESFDPAAIALDIIMPEKDRTSPCSMAKHIPSVEFDLLEQVCQLPSNDKLLASAMEQSNVVLGIAGIDGPQIKPIKAAPMLSYGGKPHQQIMSFNSALHNIDELEHAASGIAILSAQLEHGVVRKIPLIANVNGTVVPSLSLEILRVATGSQAFKVRSENKQVRQVGIADLFIPTQADGTSWVHYSKHDPSRFISAADLLNDNVNYEDLNRKLVLVGFSGLGLVDFPTTAIGERVPGVEIHAQMLETIFDENMLLRPHWATWLESTMLFLLICYVIYITPKLKTLVQIPAFMLFVSTITICGFIAFARFNLLLDFSSPLILFFILYASMQADSLIRDEGQIEGLEEDLRHQREEAAKIQGEMEAAKRFQMGIVPDAKLTFPNETRFDIAARMEPAKMVGGDLYDFFMLDDNRLFFSLGDVCGKGVPASLFMVISKTLCKSVLLRDGADTDNLGTLVSMANTEISRDNPEMLFVTAFVGVLDLTTGMLTYCNAGHEKPLVLSSNGETHEIEGMSGPPVGTIDEWDYKTFTKQLKPDEFLCVFSDGVDEAHNQQQELFGHERLLNCLSSAVQQKSASEGILESIWESVYSFVDGAEASDDITVVVVKWNSQEL